MVLRLVIVVLVIGLSCKCIEGQSATSDFLAIDCGGSMKYVDSNGMNWISDNSTDIHGEVLAVDPPEYINARANSASPLSSIRFFPGGYSKHCYLFGPDDYNISKNSAYLIRASFWAGSEFRNFTISQNTISFKLLIYTDEWETVQIDLPQRGREVNKEIYVIAIRDEIEVCLARTSPNNSDTPFISSLILRKLDSELSPVNVTKNFTEGRPLILVKRTNYGVSDEAHPGSADIRYSLNIYGRLCIRLPSMEGTNGFLKEI
ncbi:hypothetical protein KP509_33G025400 [Ceratopteris richardii]|uniref:Malectin-like domain-containing protein n=1 Tax=Ceratopteris richardii TaxID=49495 RepID=A0A8T2QNI7_CERRI|nr:hypothetical protein KP509_33G025400 [Ceratopteris richardii]KAH7285366.1 hypothetical protein KP509_33G025400 [Ceratopteris richardii]